MLAPSTDPSYALTIWSTVRVATLAVASAIVMLATVPFGILVGRASTDRARSAELPAIVGRMSRMVLRFLSLGLAATLRLLN